MPLRKKSNIKKTFWLLLVALCVGQSAAAQTSTCSRKLDQLPDSPELRGFHLGMTYDQVKARVPQIKFGHADQFGVAKTTINPFFDPRFDRASFADVRTISLDFLDGKLVTLWIGYESTFKWQTLDDFIDGISKSLNLPNEWPPKQNGRKLICDGFSVFASMIASSPSFRITDETAEDIIAQRREEDARAEESIVIGDRSTKVYYLSNCSSAGVEGPNRIAFKDKDEAEKAGYKLAKDCH